MISKGFVLQELEHGGRQRLGNAVDLIQKKDALPGSRFLHSPIHSANDFTHGIFRHGKMFAAVIPFQNPGQAHRALPGVVGHGVGNQRELFLPCNLLHNGGLSHTGRPHQQQGPLAHRWVEIVPLLILAQIRP